MVRAIVNRFPGLTLDIHLCVDRPARFIDAMAEAGASRLVFQWEAMGVNQLQSAVEFAKLVRESGMKCGVSINPATDVQEIFPLLQTELIDLVDILAVEPGFGGQTFNPIALDKISRLRQWIDIPMRSDNSEIITILVDGGINKGTSKFVIERGADILVAGTSLFRHPEGMKDALKDLNLP
jgi:ribulose-phosphate 3-epimerase